MMYMSFSPLKKKIFKPVRKKIKTKGGLPSRERWNFSHSVKKREDVTPTHQQYTKV